MLQRLKTIAESGRDWAPEPNSFALTLMLLGIVAAVMLGVSFSLLEYAASREERKQQEQIRQWQREAERAIANGTAGEATRRLFGIEPAPSKPPLLLPKLEE